MIKQIGKVLEVFIPEPDIMNSNKIGFRVKLDDGEITIIEEQDEYNSKILKDSIVEICENNIMGQEFTSIELCDGDLYE
ncbi:MAG: hypothetical protein IJO43_01245 [Bacilli bacterium]|nr:hypothetical protein [Bacilli bacterium]